MAKNNKPKAPRNIGNLNTFQILQKVYKLLKYNPEFKGLLGNIPESVHIVIFGDSGHGKTEIVMRIAKSFCEGGSFVEFVSYEQGHGLDMQMALIRNNMIEVGNKFSVTDPNYKKNPNTTYYEDLCNRIGKRGSADIFVIDSLQYLMISVTQYLELKVKFPTKGFIFISHKEGKHPEGKTAIKAGYDGGCRILVKNYIAYPEKNRFGGNDPYIIWEERARLLEQKFFLQHDKQQKSNAEIAENSDEEVGVSAHE